MGRKAIASDSIALKQDGEQQGAVEAVFCTFDVVDRDGDVCLKSGFTDGQNVKMHWQHDQAAWIGDGTISTTASEAIFTGQFWMDDPDGAKAFGKVRHASEKGLCEWSWAFNVPAGASKYGKVGDQSVRFLGTAPLEIYEVSPVAVGAGIDTRTTTIKAHRRRTLRKAIADPEAIALITQLDFAVDDLDELVGDLVDSLAVPADVEPKGEKVGRVLAQARRERIRAVIEALEKFLAEAEPAPVADPKAVAIRQMRMRAQLGEALTRLGYGHP